MDGSNSPDPMKLTGSGRARQDMMHSRASTLLACLAVGVGASVLLSLFAFSKMPVNHDAATFLLSGKLMLQGAVLYVDYVDINPPLAHYLHTLPVMTAGVFSVAPAMTFQVMILGLVLYSAVALLLVMSRSRAVRSLSGRLLVVAAFLVFSFYVFRHYDFGQREHLFALTYAPFLFCREARYRNIPLPFTLAAVIGLFGGVIFLLKPHFILLVAGVEAWMIYRERRFPFGRAPEMILVVALGFLYFIHFLFIPPPMRQAFFERWVPLVAAHYGVYKESMSLELLGELPPAVYLPVVGLAVLAVFLLARIRLKDRRLLLEALSLGMLFGMLIYLLQQKGWLYHLYPFLGLTATLAALLLTLVLESPATMDQGGGAIVKSWRWVVFCGIILTLFSGFFFFSVKAVAVAAYHNHRLRQFVPLIQAHSGAHERVAFISTDIYPANPVLLYADRLPGTRYLFSFPIAMSYIGVRANPDGSFPYRTASQRTPMEREFLLDMTADINRRRPRLVFIQQDPCQACPEGFRITDYLKKSGWMAEALTAYLPLGHTSDYMVYFRTREERSFPPQEASEPVR